MTRLKIVEGKPQWKAQTSTKVTFRQSFVVYDRSPFDGLLYDISPEEILPYGL